MKKITEDEYLDILVKIRDLTEEYSTNVLSINYHLRQKLDQYKNNWEELKKWLEQEWLEWKDCEDVMTKNFATEDKIILNKMKELEEDK